MGGRGLLDQASFFWGGQTPTLRGTNSMYTATLFRSAEGSHMDILEDYMREELFESTSRAVLLLLLKLDFNCRGSCALSPR